MKIKDFRKTSEYYTFHKMKSRIFNPQDPAYKEYGGRGLKMDARYLAQDGFFNFLKDIGRKPHKGMSVERINNAKGYIAGNIKWATAKEQARNRKSNHLLTFRGKTQIVYEWGEELGIRPKTLLQRINEYGWSTEKALTTPVRKHIR